MNDSTLKLIVSSMKLIVSTMIVSTMKLIVSTLKFIVKVQANRLGVVRGRSAATDEASTSYCRLLSMTPDCHARA